MFHVKNCVLHILYRHLCMNLLILVFILIHRHEHVAHIKNIKKHKYKIGLILAKHQTAKYSLMLRMTQENMLKK